MSNTLTIIHTVPQSLVNRVQLAFDNITINFSWDSVSRVPIISEYYNTGQQIHLRVNNQEATLRDCLYLLGIAHHNIVPISIPIHLENLLDTEIWNAPISILTLEPMPLGTPWVSAHQRYLF
jgi:hypothetical protein